MRTTEGEQVTIGQALIAARQEAGLTVEQVSAATRIRQTIVAAIEADDFSRSGGDFYARAHLRGIATAVSADADALVAAYDSERAGSGAPDVIAVFEFETHARPERRGPNWSAAMASALALVVVFAVVRAVTGTGDDSGAQTTVTAPAVTSAPTPTAAPSPRPAPPSAPPSAIAKAPRDRVTVLAAAVNGATWMQVTSSGGKVSFAGMLPKGDSMTFTDRERLRLVFGNAGGVELTVNGTEVGVPGKAGEVVRTDFTREDPVGG